MLLWMLSATVLVKSPNLSMEKSDHSNMDTRAYNNPTKSQNMNGESQQPGGKSDGQDPAGAPGGSSSRGSIGANAIHGAAEQSLSNIINQIAEAAAHRQAETERTQELNQEGKNISLSDMGLILIFPFPFRVQRMYREKTSGSMRALRMM